MSIAIGFSLIRCCIIGIPIFDVWGVTAGIEGITIRYGIKKRPPYVNEIKWIKDGVHIFNNNRKYNGGELNDGYFTIASPTIEDRGNYSCVIKNAVGSVQKDVRLGTYMYSLILLKFAVTNVLLFANE